MAPAPPPASDFFNPDHPPSSAEADLKRWTVEIERLVANVAQLERERDGWKVRAESYFDLIEGIIHERDQWKNMWFADSSGHLAAQSMLTDTLEAGHKLFAKILQQLNEHRQEKNLPLIGWDGKENGMGILPASKARLDEQRAKAPPETDWAARRDKVAAEGVG